MSRIPFAAPRRRELQPAPRSVPSETAFTAIVGRSPVMMATKGLLQKIAGSPATTVLLTGESGTGKNLAARVLHGASERGSGPFQNIACAALPETLLESELFGHEKGAFTDAKQLKRGLLELADGGTVFLDEIGEMGPALQAKLLRFLEEREFKRVGGATDIEVDVRVVAATNRNLEEGVREGSFRRDLYYRLTVLPVHLPALREREGDIPLLVDHFIALFNRDFGTEVRGVSAAALARLEGYRWPGNVRELRNAVERATLLTESDLLRAADFASLPDPCRMAPRVELPPEGIDFGELERDLTLQALQRTGWNQSRAARLLGWNRDQMRYRIRKFGLRDQGRL